MSEPDENLLKHDLLHFYHILPKDKSEAIAFYKDKMEDKELLDDCFETLILKKEIRQQRYISVIKALNEAATKKEVQQEKYESYELTKEGRFVYLNKKYLKVNRANTNKYFTWSYYLEEFGRNTIAGSLALVVIFIGSIFLWLHGCK